METSVTPPGWAKHQLQLVLFPNRASGKRKESPKGTSKITSPLHKYQSPDPFLFAWAVRAVCGLCCKVKWRCNTQRKSRHIPRADSALPSCHMLGLTCTSAICPLRSPPALRSLHSSGFGSRNSKSSDSCEHQKVSFPDCKSLWEKKNSFWRKSS